VSILSLVGSSLSALGTGFVCLCYLFLPMKPHFRHRLIQSLAVADFLNATSNSASGFYILVRNRELPEGIGCRMNGLVTQITVQATDLSILAIAIATVWAITDPITFGMWSTRKAILAVCFVWVIPFITGFTALGKDWYHPVSGNWCWIQHKPAYLRYVLTHAWRFFVIISVIILYTYLHLYLRKHYNELRSTCGNLLSDSAGSQSQSTSPEDLTVRPRKSHGVGEDGDDDDDEVSLRETPVKLHDSNSSKSSPSPHLAEDADIHVKTTMEVTEDHLRRQDQQGQSGLSPQSVAVASVTTGARHKAHTRKPSRQISDSEKRVKRILRMRAYPTFYVILVIPGIINRLVEAAGGSSKPLQLLQSSTQFVGLANAITYGLNERILAQLRKKFGR
ncbi:family A G protein-coupled receptor-like protein, partial [Tuber magnatum]